MRSAPATPVSAFPAGAPNSAAGEQPHGRGPAYVSVCIPDVNGALRGKTLTASEFDAAAERGYTSMTSLALALDPVDEPIAGLRVGPSTGAGDIRVRIEESTLRSLAWRPGWAVCLGTPLEADDGRCEIASRRVLDRALEDARELGVSTLASFEYEFRLTDGTTGAPVTPGLSYSIVDMERLHIFIGELTELCAGLEIRLQAVHTEAGPGMVEVSFEPRTGMQAADDAAMFKSALKQVAISRGMHVSFLAKPRNGEEGSGGHLHLSLWRSDENVFGGSELGSSQELDWAIGGLLGHMPAASLLYNPLINSYKRLVPGFFAPVNASWGVENRSVAVRVVAQDKPAAVHVELRRPGADANPYLVMAAAIHSAIAGLRHQIKPPAAERGDAATAPHPQASLPESLEASLQAFDRDTEFAELLGEAFSAYYRATRAWELRAWQADVSDWERARYEQTC